MEKWQALSIGDAASVNSKQFWWLMHIELNDLLVSPGKEISYREIQMNFEHLIYNKNGDQKPHSYTFDLLISWNIPRTNFELEVKSNITGGSTRMQGSMDF